MNSREHEVVDAVIVGAGAAGLFAARALGAAGRRVVVLEARPRAGGRIDTIVDEPTAPIELGPEFVHGRPRITLDLLRESGDGVIESDGDGFVRTARGLEPETEDSFESARAILERGCHIEDDCSVEDLLRLAQRDGVEARAIERTRRLVTGFDAADPVRASARAIAREWSGDATAGGSSSRPRNGYGRLVEHLVSTLDRDRVALHLGACVDAIAHDARGIDVSCAMNGVRRSVRGRAAIVTVPLGVLTARQGEAGSLTFSPALPQTHLRAIAGLAMGPVVKVILRFDRAFWKTLENGKFETGSFFMAESGAFPAIWAQPLEHATTLTAWAGGPAAAALAALGHDDVIARALDAVVAIFESPDARALLESAHFHDWQRDPFARGAYSYALVGGCDAHEALAEPIDGKLFFAGEATARAWEVGTVAGALETGARAATAVLAALSEKV